MVGFLEGKNYTIFSDYDGDDHILITVDREKYGYVNIIQDKNVGTLTISGSGNGFMPSFGGFPETFLIIAW